MDKARVNVFVVILNWNGKEDTLNCLSSLESSDYPKNALSVIVVDNGSTDGGSNAIRTAFPEVALLQNDENKGFAEGNNVGARFALKEEADFVFFLNNDTIVQQNTISELVKAFDRHANAGIVSPKIYFDYKGKKSIWFAGGDIDWANIYGKHIGVNEQDRGQYDEEKQTEFCTGCAMMVKREVLEEVGFFDGRFFAYYEDSDLSVRAKKAGFELWYIPRTTLFHKNAQSGGGTGNIIQNYFIPRNRLLFAFKHASWRTQFALIREAIRFLSTEKRQGIIDFFLLRFGKGTCRFV